MSRKNKKIIGILVSVLASLSAVLISMRVWEMNFNVPPSNSGGDGALMLSIFKSIYENGLSGLYFNPNMGAPDVAALIDTPFADINIALEVCVLSKILPSANAVFYVVYIMTFPLAAFTMFLLGEKITKNIWISTLISFFYAITPYHFYRNMGHLTLSNYYVIPIALYLMFIIYEENFKWIVPVRYLQKGNKWKVGLLYFSCLVLGFGNVYYAFFGLICMGIACVAKFIKLKSKKLFIQEAVPLYTVLTAVFLSLLPKIIYTLQNGKNMIAVIRQPLECEIYALKIIQLLLPCSYNRISVLKNLNMKYTSAAYTINENSYASLGLVASIGFIIGCCWLIYRMICRQTEINTLRSYRMDLLSLTILAIVLYSVGGGFGTFVNYFITPEIRCFNRTSIIIAALSLCIVIISLSYLCEIIKTRTGKLFGIIGLGLITIFVVYSETTSYAPNWQNNLQDENKILITFFEQIEDSLDDDAMVYELPYTDFPEYGSLYNMYDYELITPYLYTDSIRWSYGGIRGRNSSASALYIDEGRSDNFLKKIIQSGFSGIYIDTNGYDDGGDAVISYYKDKLGLEPIVSADGWLYFFNLDNIKIDEIN